MDEHRSRNRSAITGASEFSALTAIPAAMLRVKWRISEHSAGDENAIGFIRTLMMYHDIDRYFTIWKRWEGLDQPTASLLAKRYGPDKFRRLMKEKRIWVMGEEDDRPPRDSFDDDIPI